MDIEDYSISGKTLYHILKEKNIEFLYHANTVSTSITFIEQRALLSRHYIETNELHQTDQKSDSEDKKFDVWDHVFFDGSDLHKKYKTANKYGPVLFRLKLELLTSPDFTSVHVTKSNPWYWTESTTLDEKFYKDAEEIKTDYLTGKKLDSQIMFTVRKPETKIKLNKYLHSIGLDKPKLMVKTQKGELSISEYMDKLFSSKMQEHGLGHIPLLTRHSTLLSPCTCQIEYNRLYAFDNKEFVKRFGKKK